MSEKYQIVQWNQAKLYYDAVLLVGIAIYLSAFMLIGLQPHESGNIADPVVLLIRGLGSLAFLMLTLILLIGPLARMSPRILPFLYNRRHFGVVTFLVASAHFGLSLMWYHGGGPLNPLVSLFISGQSGVPFEGVPFELFGLAAWLILAVMVVTSHDYWLNTLSARVWKAVHMAVYLAYALVVFHIVLGALLTEKSWAYPLLIVIAFGLVASAHYLAARHEMNIDTKPVRLQNEGWIKVGRLAEIPMLRAKIIVLPTGERVGVFRDQDIVGAITNVCRHQGGPLGEGKIVDGCVTCPWHGWQYKLEDGVSPPPFQEQVATYNLKLEDDLIYVHSQENPLGQKSETLRLSDFPDGQIPEPDHQEAVDV